MKTAYSEYPGLLKNDDGDDYYELKPYEIDVYASVMGLVGDEGYRKQINDTRTAEGYTAQMKDTRHTSYKLFNPDALGRGVAGYTQQVTDCVRDPSEAL